MAYTNIEKLPGILLFVDFEKAFDSIEWNLISKVLEVFNFGPVIRKWFSVTYNDAESVAMNNGFSTNYFKISRVVCQGCPLSPFLFILAVEILACKIQKDSSCKGIIFFRINRKLKSLSLQMIQLLSPVIQILSLVSFPILNFLGISRVLN